MAEITAACMPLCQEQSICLDIAAETPAEDVKNTEWYTSQATIFNNSGFLTVKNIFPCGRIDSLRLAAIENFENLRRIIKEDESSLGIGIKEGFIEIVQRHLNRFEMTYKMDNDIFEECSQDPTIIGLVSSILGSDSKVVKSMVISLPGAENQSWHSDGPHLSLTTDLPCHCLNVFIPLVNVDMTNGPTSFRPESQYYTRDLTRLYMKAFVKKSLKAIESPCLTKGSILLFDYRVLHRGLANKSNEPRPVLVLTFSKPWFQDVLNYPKKSVFDKRIESPPVSIPEERNTS